MNKIEDGGITGVYMRVACRVAKDKTLHLSPSLMKINMAVCFCLLEDLTTISPQI